MRSLALLLGLTLAAAAVPAITPPALQAAAPEPAPAPQAATPVVVGYLPVSIAAPLYLGIEKGYFAEQGLAVDTQLFASGAEVLTSTAAGQLNVGTAASVGAAALNAFSRGVDVRIMATSHAENRANPTTNMVIRRVDGRAPSLPELRGRRVAINSVGVATEYVLGQALASAGLAIEDVDLQQIPFPDMVAALTNGSIDGAVMAEPFITRVVQQGVADALSGVVPDRLQTTVTYVNTRWAGGNAEAARHFAVAWVRALRDLQGDNWTRDDVVQIIAQYTHLDPGVVRASAAPYYDPDGRVNVDSIMEQQQFYIQRGSTTYRDPLDVGVFVDNSFLDYAVQQLGPYAR
jgi:ABC-type nitrate/sulfonate/bicarbonate transport system substrate-binding protein